jgi:hypothetical protein
VEIIAHLAEDELVSSWRYRQMIENSGCALSGFDQDEWARLGDYVSWKPADALQSLICAIILWGITWGRSRVIEGRAGKANSVICRVNTGSMAHHGKH